MSNMTSCLSLSSRQSARPSTHLGSKKADFLPSRKALSMTGIGHPSRKLLLTILGELPCRKPCGAPLVPFQTQRVFSRAAHAEEVASGAATTCLATPRVAQNKTCLKTSRPCFRRLVGASGKCEILVIPGWLVAEVDSAHVFIILGTGTTFSISHPQQKPCHVISEMHVMQAACHAIMTQNVGLSEFTYCNELRQ